MLERLIASQNLASVRIDSDVPTLVDFLPKQARTQRKVLQAVERIVGPRRQEIVQFNLRDLTVNDELDQTSIAVRLRELNRLEAFTYVPPFRGRAIRMIRRDQPFDKLEIDFEAHRTPQGRGTTKNSNASSAFAPERFLPATRDFAILRRGERRPLRPLRQLPAAGGEGRGRGEKGEGRKSKNRPRETPPDCGPGVAGENEGVESPLAAGPHPNPLRAPTEGWSGEEPWMARFSKPFAWYWPASPASRSGSFPAAGISLPKCSAAPAARRSKNSDFINSARTAC